MMRMLKIMSLLLFFLLPAVSHANHDWLQETMYASGKINVVLAVVTVILAGIFAYLVLLDRRIGKLEEEVMQHHENNQNL